MKFKFFVSVFFAVFGTVILSSCGSTATTRSAEVAVIGSNAVEQQVSARAQLRWNALLKRDTDGAYQFISPGGRSLMSMEQYRPRVNTGFWRGAKVKEASCAAETCDVTVLVDMTIEGVKFTNPIKESWILDAGKWWFVYQG